MTESRAIAVVGAACRLPEAAGLDRFWANLVAGHDCVTREYDNGELVRAGGVVDDVEGFDTHLFRMSAREAALLDPQHRMFLECCWWALESAGLPPISPPGLVGLFGGSGLSSYLINNVLPSARRRTDRTFVDDGTDLQMLLSADKEYLSSRVAYHLDLRGPVMTVQAACATGLYAVHLAVQSLLNGECDVALAGAASASVPQLSRHGQEPGLVLSNDGHCRSYDAAATGTVFGSGAGVVVLKLLEDAERDGDPVLGVIQGSAVGNDGSAKVGMTAPSARRQAAVIAEAIADAGLEPADISYIEGHGTATPVGDPIEVSGLNTVFGGAAGSVALGSVKSNIGHLGTAAGMAGLIKTLLCLHHRTLVPSLHFERPHPDAPFADGPLRVVTETGAWPDPPGGAPRRAGVSAFGLGGANAHVVLEEYIAPAPPAPSAVSDRRWCVPLSAASPAAVRGAAVALLDGTRGVNLPDVARTMIEGRAHLRWRVGLTAAGPDDLARSLRAVASGRRAPVRAERKPSLGMLFTGYFPESCDLRGLAGAEPVRAVVETTDPIMLAEVGVSATDVLFRGRDHGASLVVAQPAQFVLQVALTELWRSWGVSPGVVVGHSLGEFAAAHAAGVLDIDGAIRIIAARSRLLARLPGDGGMAVLGVDADQAQALIDELGVRLSIGAVNGPANTVVSGPADDVAAICARVEANGGRTKPLSYGTAGHSDAVDAVLDEFAHVVRDVPLKAPTLTVVSSVTGTPVGNEFSTPGYWVRQLRETVRFADAINQLAALPLTGYLEIGPAPVLSGMYATALPESDRPLLPSLRPGTDPWETVLGSVGALYEHGLDIDWAVVGAGAGGVRRRLPGYAFDRSRHWIDAPADTASPELPIYGVRWERELVGTDRPLAGHWLLLEDSTGTAEAVADRLRADGHLVSSIAELGLPADDNAEGDEGWVRGLTAFLENPPLPLSGVVSFAALDADAESDLRDSAPAAVTRALLVLRAVTASSAGPARTWLFTRGAVATAANEPVCLGQAGVAAAARSASREFPGLTCMRVDLDPAGEDGETDFVLDALARADEADVAYRGDARLVRRIVVDDRAISPQALDGAGRYLITGGLSDLGMLTAAILLQRGAGRVVLVGRTGDETRWAATRSRLAELAGDRAAERVAFDHADVTNRTEVDALISRHDTPAEPLRGVVHAAGLLRDATLHRQDRDTVRTALSVKAFGAANLDAALRRCASLDIFTCFTSATGVVGNAGQANYAAANAVVEAITAARAAQGKPGQSIAWGPWGEVGHLARDTATQTALERSGMGSLTTAQGKAALAALLGAGTGTVAVLANRWDRWRIGSNALEERSFAHLVTVPAEPCSDPAGEERAGIRLAAMLQAGNAAGALELATVTVTVAVVDVLGTDPAPDQDLRELGLDSLSAVQLRNRLVRSFNTGLPVNVCVEYRTPAALAGHILDRLHPGPATRDGGAA
ncbi:MAG: SDR family NAD(P)-dependent oxidoreductase [Streptosporangiaceae bacterium]|nr:SDR family NAD(P)-dependent oxidoreductase [Streptosporangiaceae bacterium]